MVTATDARVLVTALSLLSSAYAHIALWHPSMYGWDPTDANQNNADNPLSQMDFADWWFHGWINQPPAAGMMMELPAGGTFHGEVSCDKAFTMEWGYYPEQYYACPTIGPLHTTDQFGQENAFDVRGCGLGIAYKSDVNDIQPEDFTVISTNYTCPWTRSVDFQIPADLPPCPEGGCHCMWGWVHAPDAGSTQIYFLGYRCNVTNAGGTIPLPAPQIARKCPIDKTNCTVGSKQPHYWLQNERNNNFQDNFDPPYYNGDYGFSNGAQTDLFDAVSTTVAYTQTSWAEYQLYYTNSPTTTLTGPISASFTNYPSTTDSSSADPSTTSSSTATPTSQTASLSTQTSGSASTSTATQNATPSLPIINSLATEIGSPTFIALSQALLSPPSASQLLPKPTDGAQCKQSISKRAAGRLRNPNVRKAHEARAERRRMRRRGVMANSL